MGFDLNAIKQQFIAKAEELAGKEKGAVDGQLDSKKEIQLFGAELQKAVKAGTLDDYHANMLAEEFGLQLSGTGSVANTGKANAPAGARGGGLGNETNDISISVVVNIDIDVVVNACGGSEIDIEKLVDKLIDAMKDPTKGFQAFILGLIKSFAGTTDVDLSSITDLLNKIMEKLEKQGDKLNGLEEQIEGLQQSVDDLKTYIKTELTNLYEFLETKFGKLGIDISGLTSLINTNDERILTKLGEIHSAIMELSGKFQSFTEIEQQRFTEVMDAIGSIGSVGGGDPTAILNKLNIMYTLLLAIQADTSATKENSGALIDLVKQNHTEVMTAIANINTVADPEIKQMLTLVLNNMATKEDVAAEMAKLDELVTLINQGKTEVLEAIANIKNIGGGTSYDDTEIKGMLTQILSNMVTKADLDAQLVKFNELLANLEKAIELKINASETNIKNAMTDIEKNIKLAIANITINPDPENPDVSGLMQLLNDIMKKLDEMDTKNANNFSAVFQAIANIKPGDVDLTAVLNLLEQIKSIADSNGQKIQNVLNNQATIQLTLDNIVGGLTVLDGKVDGVKDVVDDIKDIVSKLHNCDCEHLDEEKLRSILCEFVKKLKDDGADEAIHGDVGGVLGARRHAPSQTKSYQQLTQDLRSVLGLGESDGIVATTSDDKNNSKVYDLGGREVTGPLKPGTVYIKDGKKFIAK